MLSEFNVRITTYISPPTFALHGPSDWFQTYCPSGWDTGCLQSSDTLATPTGYIIKAYRWTLRTLIRNLTDAVAGNLKSDPRTHVNISISERFLP